MSEPILEEQLLNLPPKAKILMGVLLGGGGVAACVVLWESGWIVWAAVFAAVMGPAVALTGSHELARARALDVEVRRAREEWAELERGIQTARRDGQSVARYLQAKGYREHSVRHWIATELDPGAGRG